MSSKQKQRIDPDGWYDSDSEGPFSRKEAAEAIRRNKGNRRLFHQCGRPEITFEKVYPKTYSRLINGGN